MSDTTLLLDAAPLVAAINLAARGVGYERRSDGHEFRVGPANWAERQGLCSERQYHRWKNGARVSVATADRIAVALGWHPAELWGHDWWALPTIEAEDVAA